MADRLLALARLLPDRVRRRILPGATEATVVIPWLDFQSGLGQSAWVLYGLVRAMRPTLCVEIGSARGRSACFVGLGLKHNGQGKLVAIDPHEPTDWNDTDSVDTLATMRANLAAMDVAAQVEIRRAYSDRAAEGWTAPIDLLFIDGDHTYEGVKRDFALFAPHVKEFGLVVFHDTIWERRPDPRWARADMGVPRFVEELRQQGYPVTTLEHDCGVSLVQPRVGGVPLAATTTG